MLALRGGGPPGPHGPPRGAGRDYHKRIRTGPDFTDQEREMIKSRGACLDHMRAKAFGDIPCPRGRACRHSHKAEGEVAAIVGRYPHNM